MIIDGTALAPPRNWEEVTPPRRLPLKKQGSSFYERIFLPEHEHRVKVLQFANKLSKKRTAASLAHDSDRPRYRGAQRQESAERRSRSDETQAYQMTENVGIYHLMRFLSIFRWCSLPKI